jgi:hypothetical protein
MNLTFSGYVSFVCLHCQTALNLDSPQLALNHDTRPETADDNSPRYHCHWQGACTKCQQGLGVAVDVWEQPEGVVNYAYYNEQGIYKVDCEFAIQYDDSAELCAMGKMLSEEDEDTYDSADDDYNGWREQDHYDDETH